jgi:alkylresorcinol/alkylpyrone synthase
MPIIVAATHALPPHVVAQSEARELVGQFFSGDLPELDRLLAVFDHSRIQCRQFMRPAHWYLQPSSFAERNRIYSEEGLDLVAEAARNCLHRSGFSPAQVDHVIFVSSTGYATPTLDAHLINALGMKPATSRVPIWGLGCAGGAAGLARAFDYCLGHPDAVVLITALECCSLTFMENDLTKKNLIATAIFSGGAAAVVVAGDRVGTAGPHISGTRSHLFPDSYRIMGWDFHGDGMELVLSPKLPAVIKQELPGLVDDFLANRDLRRRDLRHFITHPGGAKVIDAYRQALDLTLDDLALTEELLCGHGNISSVSVLVVLEKWLASERAKVPGWGLLSAFGPGFSAEMILLEN